jgi:hypothetical protein
MVAQVFKRCEKGEREKNDGGTSVPLWQHRLEAGATKFKKRRGDPPGRPFFYQSQTPHFNSDNWH